MQIFFPFLISTVAGLSTVLGALIIFIKIKKENISRFITFCLSLSLSIMIMLSITELIPSSTYIILANYKLLPAIIIITISFLSGYTLINFINKQLTSNSQDSLYKLGILSMIALMAHNLPEGVATYISSYQDLSLGIKLAISIILHNIPEGISIAVPIYYSTKNKWLSIKYTLLSGLAEPLGAILTYLLLQNYISSITLSITLIFVAGIMITLAINKLLKEAISYNQPQLITIGFLSGIILTIINHFIF